MLITDIHVIMDIEIFLEDFMVKLILDQFLQENGISRYRLAQLTDIKYQIIDNYYKNKVVRYDGYILSKICQALDCKISDILVFIPD